jgi:hypothetical protein
LGLAINTIKINVLTKMIKYSYIDCIITKKNNETMKYKTNNNEISKLDIFYWGVTLLGTAILFAIYMY